MLPLRAYRVSYGDCIILVRCNHHPMLLYQYQESDRKRSQKGKTKIMSLNFYRYFTDRQYKWPILYDSSRICNPPRHSYISRSRIYLVPRIQYQEVVLNSTHILVGYQTRNSWGFRNFCSCLRTLYTILLPDEKLFRNLLVFTGNPFVKQSARFSCVLICAIVMITAATDHRQWW
jgi:hypothetical protein